MDQATILQELSGQDGFLTVPRLYVRIMGDISGGVFLSELIRQGALHQSYPEWEAQLGLSPYSIRKYSKMLQDAGFLSVRNAKLDGAPTLLYRFDVERFSNWLASQMENENFNFPSETENLENEKFQNPIVNNIDPKERNETLRNVTSRNDDDRNGSSNDQLLHRNVVKVKNTSIRSSARASYHEKDGETNDDERHVTGEQPGKKELRSPEDLANSPHADLPETEAEPEEKPTMRKLSTRQRVTKELEEYWPEVVQQVLGRSFILAEHAPRNTPAQSATTSKAMWQPAWQLYCMNSPPVDKKGRAQYDAVAMRRTKSNIVETARYMKAQSLTFWDLRSIVKTAGSRAVTGALRDADAGPDRAPLRPA